jgi:hypothetical protein
MEDDLIDDSGFELGMPTRVEMLKHQCTLLRQPRLVEGPPGYRQTNRNIPGDVDKTGGVDPRPLADMTGS